MEDIRRPLELCKTLPWDQLTKDEKFSVDSSAAGSEMREMATRKKERAIERLVYMLVNADEAAWERLTNLLGQS